MRTFSDLRGVAVIDATGRVIGQIEDVVLDPRSWRAEALRVKLDRSVTNEIGAAHGAFRAARVDVPVDFVQDLTDTVVLNKPVGALQPSEEEERPRGEAH